VGNRTSVECLKPVEYLAAVNGYPGLNFA